MLQTWKLVITFRHTKIVMNTSNVECKVQEGGKKNIKKARTAGTLLKMALKS